MGKRKQAQDTEQADPGQLPLSPVEPEDRAAFAERQLRERNEDTDPDDGEDEPGAYGAPPRLTERDPAEDAADASALARLLLLVPVWLAARRPSAVPDVIEDRRKRANTRAQRLGERIGGRLGRIVGAPFLYLGLAADCLGEGLEEAIDGAIEDAQRREADQRATPTPGQGNP